MPSPPALSPSELARYHRHLLLSQIGLAGQQRLAAARVLIVGAGGLGSPAALYLAAAGVGTLGLADFDHVETHNLQRQLLHDDTSIGEAKVTSAARRLQLTNPFVHVPVHPHGVTPENAGDLFSQYDIILDGTDNFTSRYLNNDAAFFARRPLIYGSVFRFEGQVSVFDPARGGPCYRCLFPEPPAPGSIPNCGEAGVLGAVCGVIGSLQALEVIKLITGAGEPLRGRLLHYDALAPAFHSLNLPANPTCPLCGTTPSILAVLPAANSGLTCRRFPAPAASPNLKLPADHSLAPPCPSLPAPSSMPNPEFPLEIDVVSAQRLHLADPTRTVIIDVREPYELEICHIPGAEPIPMRTIPAQLERLPRDKHLLILCHSGGRSGRITDFLRAQGFLAVSNITGGIDAWAQALDPTMRRY